MKDAPLFRRRLAGARYQGRARRPFADGRAAGLYRRRHPYSRGTGAITVHQRMHFAERVQMGGGRRLHGGVGDVGPLPASDVSPGAFDARDASMLRTLPDLLTEVATLSTAVGRVALSSATNALDLIGRPAIALDRFGLVLGVNQTAAAIFDDDFRIRNRRLFASDPRAYRDLQALAGRLLSTPECEPLPMLSIVVRRRDKPITIARTLPVHAAARNPFLGARVLLVFSEAKVRARLSGLSGQHLWIDAYGGEVSDFARRRSFTRTHRA